MPAKYTSALIDDAQERNIFQKGDLATGAAKVAMYVWDSETLAWVRWDGASSGGSSSSTVYLDTRYDFDASGNPEYVGKHATEGASMDDPSWRITKYLWDVDGNPSRKMGPLVGSWNNREYLGW